MRVHHINCGTMCPIGFELFKVQPKPYGMICHVLVIETNDGLCLVDTGIGTGDLRDPKGSLGGPFVRFVRPKLSADETALAQVEKLGFRADDVRHIIPTHLDLDHAGGLPDFPKAKVHIYGRELDAAMARATFDEKMRYRPAHFAHEPKWKRYEVEGEPWFGFDCVRQLEGLPPEILMVPTIGHTRGHVSIAVAGEDGFMVHAGDAYFHRDEMDPERPSCPGPLRVFQRSVATDDVARRRNQERLRMLVKDEPSVRIFCAHDPIEATRYGVQ